jgi:hypothetical protein
MPERKARRERNCTGQSISEFGATITVLIVLILIPLLSLAFVPIRYSMCQGVISDLIVRLAHSEKRSDAYRTFLTDQRWRKLLAGCGADVRSAKLVLVASTSGGKQIIIDEKSRVPPEWLPDGKNNPCIYSLHIDCECGIAPLFGSTGNITGINAPVPLTVSSSAHWDNQSRDPKDPNLAFCIDE